MEDKEQEGVDHKSNTNPVHGLVMPDAWLHIMDNTEGEEDAAPLRELSFSQNNPFGIPGIDYDAEFQVTSKPLYLTD